MMTQEGAHNCSDANQFLKPKSSGCGMLDITSAFMSACPDLYWKRNVTALEPHGQLSQPVRSIAFESVTNA